MNVKVSKDGPSFWYHDPVRSVGVFPHLISISYIYSLGYCLLQARYFDAIWFIVFVELWSPADLSMHFPSYLNVIWFKIKFLCNLYVVVRNSSSVIDWMCLISKCVLPFFNSLFILLLLSMSEWGLCFTFCAFCLYVCLDSLLSWKPYEDHMTINELKPSVISFFICTRNSQ